MPDELEDFGQDDRAAENVALVDEIGQAAGARFGLEFMPGPIAFLREDRDDARPELTEQRTAHGILDQEVPLLVELASCFCGHSDVHQLLVA